LDSGGTGVEFSGDGSRFVFYKARNEGASFTRPIEPQLSPLEIQVMDTVQGRKVGNDRMSAAGSVFVLNRDGSLLAYVTPVPAGGTGDASKATDVNSIAVLDLASGKEVVLHQGMVSRSTYGNLLTFSSDSKLLAAAVGNRGPRGEVYVWDLT